MPPLWAGMEGDPAGEDEEGSDEKCEKCGCCCCGGGGCGGLANEVSGLGCGCGCGCEGFGIEGLVFWVGVRVGLGLVLGEGGIGEGVGVEEGGCGGGCEVDSGADSEG